MNNVESSVNSRTRGSRDDKRRRHDHNKDSPDENMRYADSHSRTTCEQRIPPNKWDMRSRQGGRPRHQHQDHTKNITYSSSSISNHTSNIRNDNTRRHSPRRIDYRYDRRRHRESAEHGMDHTKNFHRNLTNGSSYERINSHNGRRAEGFRNSSFSDILQLYSPRKDLDKSQKQPSPVLENDFQQSILRSLNESLNSLLWTSWKRPEDPLSAEPPAFAASQGTELLLDKKQARRSLIRGKSLMIGLSQPVRSCKAERMMRKMGWKGGRLGAKKDGIKEPIVPNLVMVSDSLAHHPTIPSWLMSENEPGMMLEFCHFSNRPGLITSGEGYESVNHPTIPPYYVNNINYEEICHGSNRPGLMSVGEFCEESNPPLANSVTYDRTNNSYIESCDSSLVNVSNPLVALPNVSAAMSSSIVEHHDQNILLPDPFHVSLKRNWADEKIENELNEPLIIPQPVCIVNKNKKSKVIPPSTSIAIASSSKVRIRAKRRLKRLKQIRWYAKADESQDSPGNAEAVSTIAAVPQTPVIIKSPLVALPNVSAAMSSSIVEHHDQNILLPDPFHVSLKRNWADEKIENELNEPLIIPQPVCVVNKNKKSKVIPPSTSIAIASSSKVRIRAKRRVKRLKQIRWYAKADESQDPPGNAEAVSTIAAVPQTPVIIKSEPTSPPKLQSTATNDCVSDPKKAISITLSEEQIKLTSISVKAEMLENKPRIAVAPKYKLKSKPLKIVIFASNGTPITLEHMESITTQLVDLIFVANPSTSLPDGPIFHGKPIHSDGVVHLWCGNASTQEWLTNNIHLVSVAEIGSLAVRPVNCNDQYNQTITPQPNQNDCNATLHPTTSIKIEPGVAILESGATQSQLETPMMQPQLETPMIQPQLETPMIQLKSNENGPVGVGAIHPSPGVLPKGTKKRKGKKKGKGKGSKVSPVDGKEGVMVSGNYDKNQCLEPTQPSIATIGHKVVIVAKGSAAIPPKDADLIMSRLLDITMAPVPVIPEPEGGLRFLGKPTFGDGMLKLWCADSGTLDWLGKVVAMTMFQEIGPLEVRLESDLDMRVC